jgi:hypothetical protein
MKVTINGIDVELKYTMRSLMIYEKIYGKTFQPEGLSEMMVYFYSTILASDKNVKLSFDEFLDMLDNNPEMLTDFANWLTATTSVNKYIKNEEETPEENPDPNV